MGNNAEEKGWQLEPIAFTSRTPLVGPIVAALRRAWHAIAGKWALQHLIDQQNGFNLVASRQILALDEEQDELQHEVALLATQLKQLQRQLAELQEKLEPGHG